jgi:hypothetical protein
MFQNADIWYFLEKGRDMDLCSTFTTRTSFAAGRDMDICSTFTTRFAAGKDMDSKVDDFSTVKLFHAKTANLMAK